MVSHGGTVSRGGMVSHDGVVSAGQAVVLDFQFNSGFRVVLDAVSCIESEAEILEANKIGSAKSKDILASIRRGGP